MSRPYNARAYGCRWRSAFPLPLFQAAELTDGDSTESGHPDVLVSPGAANAAPRAFHLSNGRQRFCADGLRYAAHDGTVIDTYGTDRLEVTPGSAWHGEPPAAFYGTATAALLAARGDLPIHGSAVAINGRAVLLCGHSGAGKSTLTAALIAAGGALISDDLSAVHMRQPEGRAVLFAGRRAIRLFPDVAEMLGQAVAVEVLSPEGERKVLAMPPAASPSEGFPLAAVLILESALPEFSLGTAALALLEYGYRRRAARHLPGHGRRVEIARSVAASVPFLGMPAVEARGGDQFRKAGETVIRLLASATV